MPSFLWECLQNSFEMLLVAFDVQVCELFVYNGCIHSCQLQKHRRLFNHIQSFLVKASRTAEQRQTGAGQASGSTATHLTLLSLSFPTHTDSTRASSHLQRFHVHSCPNLWFIAQRRSADLVVMFKSSMAWLQESERLSKHYKHFSFPIKLKKPCLKSRRVSYLLWTWNCKHHKWSQSWISAKFEFISQNVDISSQNCETSELWEKKLQKLQNYFSILSHKQASIFQLLLKKNIINAIF